MYIATQPTTMVETNVLMIVTSAKKSDLANTWYKEEIIDSNNPEVLSLNIEMVCPDCQTKSLQEMMNCRHTDIDGSRLINDERRRNNNKSKGAISQLAAENMNVVIMKDNDIFYKSDVERFFKNRISPKENAEFFMLGFDPAYGGPNDTAMTIVGKFGDKFVLCWAGFQNTAKLPENDRWVLENVSEFRKIYGKETPIIIAIEANGRFDGEYMDKLFKDAAKMNIIYENVFILIDESNSGEKCGVTTSKEVKNDGIKRITSYFETNSLAIHDKFNTIHPEGKDFVLEKLEHQMSHFRLDIKGVKKDDTNNDGALALILAIYWWYKLKRDQNAIYYTQRSKAKIASG